MPDYPISEIAVSGDGTRLAVSGRAEQISSDELLYFVDILDASTLEIISSVEVGSRQPDMLNLSPDGRWLVYNVDYFELSTIDTLTGQKSVLLEGPAEVGAVDWSPVDGRLAYSVGTATSIMSFTETF
ncbi:MAG: beta-propeller fold lactonase family protein [Anaerolineae bacterium]